MRAALLTMLLLGGLVAATLSAQTTPTIRLGAGAVFGLFTTGAQLQVESGFPGGWMLNGSLPIVWPSERDPVTGYQDRADVWAIPQIGVGWRGPSGTPWSMATDLSTGVELAWLDEAISDPTYGIDSRYTHAAVSWKNELRVRLDWMVFEPWGVEACLSFNLAAIARSRLAVLAVWAPRTD